MNTIIEIPEREVTDIYAISMDDVKQVAAEYGYDLNAVDKNCLYSEICRNMDKFWHKAVSDALEESVRDNSLV